MAATTDKQKIQHMLAWKLRQVRAARGNLYPREEELKQVDERIKRNFEEIIHKLTSVDELIVKALHEIK